MSNLKFLFFLSAILFVFSSCSTSTILTRATNSTRLEEHHLGEEFPNNNVQVIIEGGAESWLPHDPFIQRTKLLVLPLIFYTQISKEFEIRPGQQNLQYLTSNLQGAIEAELARNGGLPNCQNCQLRVQMDTIRTRIPYVDDRRAIFFLIAGVTVTNLHMGPSAMELRVHYSLYEGEREVHHGKASIWKETEALRPGFFDGPRRFPERYLEYYYSSLNNELDGIAVQIVTPLQERWGKL